MLPVVAEPTAKQDDLLWEKQAEESAKAYAAFLSYRGLPAWKRSIKRAVISQFGYHTQAKQRQFQTWSAKHSWVVRATAWDEETAREGDAAVIEQVKEMRTRHLQLAKALQQKAIERLKKLEAEEMSLTDLISFLRTGTNLERLAMGQTPEMEAAQEASIQNVFIDYSTITTEQLIQVIARKQLGE